ncbi:MAG: chemotaxis protein [Lachnospiraceae bacterium]|nr:chemotaxis protein [Lachnospiraceae bacterium]
MADTKILLDSTQGELEILEFIVNDVRFGINVAKVQEIVVKQKVTPIPSSAFGIRGIFNIRDGLYSVIDLGLVLFNRETELTNKTYYMLCNFNNQRNAFIVDSVVGIRRVSWSSLMKPDNILSGSETSNIIGILNLDNDIISVLDFEKIVTDINPSSGLKVDEVVITDDLQVVRGSHTILIADDSKMINKLLTDTVSKAGYKVISVEDGELT